MGNRVVKFRGKRVDNGEWVVGYYWSNDLGNHFIRQIIDGEYNYVCTDYEVDPEIVGQYTGLKDKNGVEICEGDIVTAHAQAYRAIGEVRSRIDGLWLLYPAYQHGKLWGLSPNPKGQTKVEVIGNIHDNPELLKNAL